MITLMVGQFVGLLGVSIAKDYGITSVVAYDNLEMYRQMGLRVYSTIHDERFIVDVLRSDILLSVHGREIVPIELLRKARYAVNVHPFYKFFKGANPVKRAIKHHVQQADVTAHEMTEKLDEGKIIAQETMTVIGQTEEEIYKQLYPLYAKVIKDAVNNCVVSDKQKHCVC